eukprot:TRINITY_DN35681_c0_g1_i1.p1 TRINITY_DN35681_c0_g1~~TRINITY_DN35681_c0_g1_i1.p1  ORF type:complete len:499 (+),score=58.81 TRINITY_DN35681_c0_g1_i1:57-1499(+)
MDRLSLGSLSRCFAGAAHSAVELASYSAVCKSVNEALKDDMTWINLCYYHWHATEERRASWPALSAHSLYRALEQWVPAEGFYVLSSAFPWGLLVLLRIVGGQVEADAIRFAVSSSSNTGLEELRVRLFTVSLQELPGAARQVQSVVDIPWWHEEEDNANQPPCANIGTCDPTQLRAVLPAYQAFFGGNVPLVDSRYIQVKRAMQLSFFENVSPEEDAGSEPDLERELESWLPHQMHTSGASCHEATVKMFQEMFKACKLPCQLALIRGPADFVPAEDTFAGLRAGLYVGDYGHNFYGQYRSEVLLVEYVHLSAAEVKEEARSPSRVFARPSALAEKPEFLDELAALDVGITFVRGVKQCGDVHVPMGATTFVAVCQPAEAKSLMESRMEACPSLVNTRGGRQPEHVRRSWHGWGTLAMPGFGSPSWAYGWLCQLDDDADRQSRFGFCWDRNQEMITLNWIRAQDTSPFLQRDWLPTGLQ